MRHCFPYLITSKDAGRTVEQFLLSRGYSRHLIIDLKKTPVGLTVGGRHIYVTHRLAKGEELIVELPAEAASETIVPTAMVLDIVYEDDHILIINKAADTPVHPSQGNFSNTLANGAAWYFREKGEPFVCRVINRLDRDTTGLLILAKHSLSVCILSDMIRNHEIHRTYLAAVSGDMRNLFPPHADPSRLPCGLTFRDARRYAGTVTAPIARVDGSTIERHVDMAKGEYACTHFTVLSYRQETDTSLVELRLETGRTHQIRVHMKHLGYPLLGDFLYNPDYRLIGRQSLHSRTLEFAHPMTKEPLTFTAAVPDDMSVFVDIGSGTL